MENSYDNNGFMIVRENYCCDHFEPDEGALVPMKECWCCKLARFDAEIHELNSKSVGICQYEGNRCEVVESSEVSL